MVVAMIVVFLVLLVLGVPIAFGTGVGTIVYLLGSDSLSLLVLAQKMWTTMDSFTTLAIPLFMLAGSLMNGGGITKRIVELSGKLVGHITGSLGHVTILASMLFASMSGSCAASCAAIGGMLIPAMKEKGYDPDYAVGVTSVASIMGPIIPPSIAFIIYSSISGDSVGRLFMGGVIPGVMMGLAMMVFAYAIAKKRHFPVEPKASWAERGRSFLHAIPALFMPVIILGGIMGGIFTATEAGAVACVYGFFVGVVSKELDLKKLPDVLCDAAQTTAMVMMIMGTSQLFGWLLTLEKIPTMLANAVQGVTSNPIGVFFLLMLLVLFLGCFMTDAAVMLIMTPLMLPLVKSVGIDTVHFGVVINMMAVAGGLTPPVGNLLYIAANIAGIPVLKALRGLIPFLIAVFIVMAVCIFIPPLVTFLPNLLA